MVMRTLLVVANGEHIDLLARTAQVIGQLIREINCEVKETACENIYLINMK